MGVRNLLAAVAGFASWLAVYDTGAASKPLTIEQALSSNDFCRASAIGISPNGRWLTYATHDPHASRVPLSKRNAFFLPTGVARSLQGCQVAVVEVSTGRAVNLGPPDISWDAAWSPDGRYLAFYSDRDGAAHLWVWDSIHDRVRRVSDAIVREFVTDSPILWLPDSRGVVVKVLPVGVSVEQALDWTESYLQDRAGAKSAPGDALEPDSTVIVYHAEPHSASDVDASSRLKDKPVPRPIWADIYRGDLARIDVETNTVTRLALDVRSTVTALSSDGAELAWSEFRRIAADESYSSQDIRVCDVSTDAIRTLLSDVRETIGGGLAMTLSPRGTWLAYTVLGTDHRGDLHVVPLSGGGDRNLTASIEHPPFGTMVRPPLWASDDLLYVHGAPATIFGRRGGRGVWQVSASGGTAREITLTPGTELAGIVSAASSSEVWSKDRGRTLLLSARLPVTGESAFIRLDTQTGLATTLYRGHFESPDRDQTDIDRRGAVAFVRQSAASPPEVWLASADFRKLQSITHLNEGLGGISFGSSRVIEWHSADGTLLHGALLLPSDYVPGRRYPLIVNIYGGSLCSVTVNEFGLQRFATGNLQILATRGYAVLCPDAPLVSRHRMEELSQIVIPAVEEAVRLGIADSDRVGVMGYSYGGYSTLALIALTQRFKAAIAGAGPGDLISDYGTMTRDGTAGYITWVESGQGDMRGSPWAERDRYIENSPIFFLDRVSTPLLLIHGDQDLAVPPAQSDEVFVGLRQLGKEVSYARYRGEDHNIHNWTLANRIDYWKRVLEWFDRHLK